MCMLTAIYYGGKGTFTAPFLVDLLNIDSTVKGNNDGTGFSQKKNTFKTEIGAHLITNLGKLAHPIIKDREIAFGHVRAASPGVDVCKENSHPFVGEKSGLILYHNGTLSIIKEPKWYADKTYKEKREYSDSRLFLEELENELAKLDKRNIPLALQNTMKNFSGKFAFLIYDPVGNKAFAARGKLAKLHIAYIGSEEAPELVSDATDGWIINTEDAQLSACIREYTNREEAYGREPIKFSEVLLLTENTIFFLGKKSPIPVGTIEETPRPVATTVFHRSGYKPHKSKYPAYTDSRGNASVPLLEDGKRDKRLDRLSAFMKEHLLSPMDIDLLFQFTRHSPLSEVNETHLSAFVDEMIPKLSAPKTLREWMSARKWAIDDKVVPSVIYTKGFGLEYPWMMNEDNAIRTAILKYENATRDRR